MPYIQAQVISNFPYFEDFEVSDGGWTASGTNSSWEYGVPVDNVIDEAARCSQNAWVTDLDADYNNGEESFLTSPLMDFSGFTSDPILSFDQILDLENCCDETWIEVSTDFGTTWTKLGSASTGLANWYNDFSNEWWDEDADWRVAADTLRGTAGEDSVLIRFSFDSDGSANENGVGIDNIRIADMMPDTTYPLFAVALQITSPTTCAGTMGAISATPNGTPPYTYLWSTGDTTAAISGVGVGVYSVDVSDADGCTATETINLSCEINIFPYFEDFEASTGGWAASGTNSSWEYGVPVDDVIDEAGRCSQNAWVTDLDADYNNSQESFLVSPLLDFSGIFTDPVLSFDQILDLENCCDETWVEFSTDFGMTWNKVGTAATGIANWYNDAGNDWWDEDADWRVAASPLLGVAGEDSVLIRFVFDSDGSVNENGVGIDNIRIDVVIPDTVYPVFEVALQIDAPTTCTGNAGAISAIPDGTPPYTYLWSNGDTTATISGLGVGIYSVTVMDADGCSVEGEINLSCEVTSFPYFEDFEASTGGWGETGTNSSWEYGVPMDDVIFEAARCSQNAWVTDLDADYNDSEESFLVSPLMDFSGFTSDPILSFDQILDLESCCDETWVEVSTDFGATWTKVGTATTGLFNWYNDASNDWWDEDTDWRVAADTLRGTAGEDSVLIRFAFDSDGSVNENGVGIDNIRIADMMPDTVYPILTVSLQITAPTTCTGTTGAISATPDGASPYTYLWSTGDTTAAVSGLGIGGYSVAVTDANGCTTIESITISCDVTSFPYFEDFEDNNGGWLTSGANVSWEYGTPVDDVIAEAARCSQNAWVTNLDEDYNNSEESFLVSPLMDFSGFTSDPVLSFDQTLDLESCCDETWVEVSIDFGDTWTKVGSATTGLSNWYNDASSDWWDEDADWRVAADTLRGTAGEDSVLIRFAFDSDGSVNENGVGIDNVRIDPASVILTEYPDLLVSTTVVDSNAACFGELNGGATTSATGGTAPYSYLWSNNDTTASITGVGAGTYTITITDANGCTAMDEVTLSEPLELVTAVVVDSNVVCFGELNGGATVSTSGGADPYTYLWSNTDTTTSITGVAADSYTVIVTDADGCTTLDTVMITEPDTLVAAIVLDNAEICLGDTDGALTASATGGTEMYMYSWSDGQDSTTALGLDTGTYVVTITDAKGCTALDSATVVNTMIDVNVSQSVDQGVVTLTSDEVGATYQWLNCTDDDSEISGEANQTFTPAESGNYAVEITLNGCVDTSACTSVVQVSISPGFQQNNVSMYPNPTSGQFTIDLGEVSQQVVVRITTLRGKVVQTHAYAQVRVIEDQLEAPEGVYIVTVLEKGDRKAVFRLLHD